MQARLLAVLPARQPAKEQVRVQLLREFRHQRHRPEPAPPFPAAGSVRYRSPSSPANCALIRPTRASTNSEIRIPACNSEAGLAHIARGFVSLGKSR